MTAAPTAEFSHILKVDSLGEAPRHSRLEATPEARAALARRFGLEAIESLLAELPVERIKGGTEIGVVGRVTATIVQICVVSQEPVVAHIDEAVEARFAPPGEDALEVEFSLDDEDPPEPFSDDAIDLGELAAQCFAMAIDPYPRAPGAAAPSEFGGAGDTDPLKPTGPFAGLAAFKRDQR